MAKKKTSKTSASKSRKSGTTGRSKTAGQSQEEDQEQLPGFEESLRQIQQIIEGIESGEVSLEQSLDQYARGMKLIRHCRSVLDRAEQRIEQLTLDEEGELVEQEDEDER